MGIDFTRRQFNLNGYWTEAYFLFCISVAGKRAGVTATKIDGMLEDIGYTDSPITYLIGDMSPIYNAKIGKYGMLSNMLEWFSIFVLPDSPGEWLKSANLDQLLAVPAVGNKTAKFFLTHCRGETYHAILDTHIKQWLTEQGYKLRGMSYSEIEQLFIEEAMSRGLTPSELDLSIWTQRSKS